MKADGVPPNTIAYNTAIGACAFFGRPNKAWNNNRETSSFIRPTSTVRMSITDKGKACKSRLEGREGRTPHTFEAVHTTTPITC